ncbi:hypothetical protein [Pelagicoccus mobilis]|uniref:Uncharacterized protein n=1 Tax=Pelagicoccus mobilis TaxID=415221 RepID=A0A934S2J5_9BACT|nr:hypothetical protein [Pelagicoccus mobilis]MBK1879914.1 hypothetical protein [Pelagicoccus mobilis]
MDSKDEFLEIEWDRYSEQPYPIRHRRNIWKRARYSFVDYVKTFFTTVAFLPFIVGYQFVLNFGRMPKRWKQRGEDIKDFAGLAIALHSSDAESNAELIRELGVRRILLRVPVWEIDELDKYVGFIDSLPDCDFVVCIMQTRNEVIDAERWRKLLRQIVERCWPRVKVFQIGQGINRSKWGFFSTGEFLRFASVAEEMREDFPGIELVGPCILDFETMPLFRCITHGHKIFWDAVGCALYVDRRGSPKNRQLLFFDFRQKLLHFVACIRFATKAQRRFWITEVNWPIADQGPYSPTHEPDCVCEEDAAVYLRQYYEEAWDSGLVERVYWWQLIAKGFGLVDVGDDGSLRKRPGFYEFKRMLDNGLEDRSEPVAQSDDSKSSE